MKTVKPLVMKAESNHVWVGGRWMPMFRPMRKASAAARRETHGQKMPKGYEGGWARRWRTLSVKANVRRFLAANDLNGAFKEAYAAAPAMSWVVRP